MDPLISSSLIGAGGGFLGSLLNSFGLGQQRQIRTAKDLATFQAMLEYQWNQKAADKDFQRQLELYEKQLQRADYEWQRDTAYNSAAAQRSRLTDAGLLGASLFSGGTAGMPSVSNGPNPANTGRTPGVSVGFPGEHLTGPNSFDTFFRSAMSFAQMANIQSQTDLNKSQSGELETRSLLESTQAQLLSLQSVGEGIKNDLLSLDKELFKATFDNKVGYSNAQFQLMTEQALQATIKTAVDEYHRKNIQPLERRSLLLNLQLMGAKIGYYGALTREANSNIAYNNAATAHMWQMFQSAIFNNQILNIESENAIFDQQVRYGGAIRWVNDEKGHRVLDIKPITYTDANGQKHNLYGTEFLRQRMLDAMQSIQNADASNYKLRFYLDYLFRGLEVGAKAAGSFSGLGRSTGSITEYYDPDGVYRGSKHVKKF